MSNSAWISKIARSEILVRDNLTCAYCGIVCEIYSGVRKLNTATLDHIVSQKELAESATDDKDFKTKRRDPKNLVCVCSQCNSSKQDTALYVWCAQKGLNYASILAEISRRIAKPIAHKTRKNTKKGSK